MRYPIFIVLAIFLYGCHSWPPHLDEVRSNFESQSVQLNRLADKLKDSNHRSLSRPYSFNTSNSGVLFREIGATSTSIHTSLSKYVDGEKLLITSPIKDDPEWLELMNSVGAFDVSREEGSRVVVGLLPQNSDSRLTLISYIRDGKSREKLKSCKDTFEILDCGRCKIDLGIEWYVLYGWRPNGLFPYTGDEEADLLKGKQNLNACMDAADRVIGYKSDPFEYE